MVQYVYKQIKFTIISNCFPPPVIFFLHLFGDDTLKNNPTPTISAHVIQGKNMKGGRKEGEKRKKGERKEKLGSKRVK
jgi:hypothetical protein